MRPSISIRGSVRPSVRNAFFFKCAKRVFSTSVEGKAIGGGWVGAGRGGGRRRRRGEGKGVMERVDASDQTCSLRAAIPRAG